jgi:hypothetical protein
MKTTWNHSGKKRALGCFVFGCVLMLCFAPLDFFYPELRTLKSFCYDAGILAFTCFFGYRVFFHSDDWFRVKEEKSTIWWGNHPRLEIAVVVLIWLAIIIYNFWPHFHKH